MTQFQKLDTMLEAARNLAATYRNTIEENTTMANRRNATIETILQGRTLPKRLRFMQEEKRQKPAPKRG